MMDSVVGDDVTLPVDINGSCQSPDSINAGEFSSDSMTAPSFPDKMSPIKALTMKDYENQITASKKENFNSKLRIYFMEERMQQKCDDSTEDIFKTNIELKVELESMKRESAEKQELLVSASKALESLAGRESGEPQRVREQAQREMDALREEFSKKIAESEQSLQAAEEEVEKMATIAEQEKLKNINSEKQLQAVASPGIGAPTSLSTSPVQDLQQASQEKDMVIEQLKLTVKNQEDLIQQKSNRDPPTDSTSTQELSDLIAEKDRQLQESRDELHGEKDKAQPDEKSDVNRLESINKMSTEELNRVKRANENMTKMSEDSQSYNKTLSVTSEEKENELDVEKKNALKRDKTIQGLTQVLREKEKEIEESCQEIEDRDDALTKAREAAHKAQSQKYQGVEEHQNSLMEKQTESAQLQGEHHTKVLEAQKLQRALDRKEQDLADSQQSKDSMEAELEESQQQKKKGDKASNDLTNQSKKSSDEMKERESAVEQQYQESSEQTKRKSHSHEATIQRLTTTSADKEQQLQEYINMVRDLEQSKSPGSNDGMLTKSRQRSKEKESASEQASDDKFAAIEEKDNEIHQSQSSLREKERDLDRLNNSLAHNEETINNFDSLIKEKDVESQHLVNTSKNLRRAKQDVEDNLNRSSREKDSIIHQLQLSLEGKTKDMEEMAEKMSNQSQSQARDSAEQMGQRSKVAEAMSAEAVKARERLIADNESAVEGSLATINSKDQLLKESAEHFNRMSSERAQEIQESRKQLADKQQELAKAEKRSSSTSQESYLETAELRTLLAEKDSLIDKLSQRGQERDRFSAEMSQKAEADHVLELRQTIQIMQEKLDERDGELSRRNSEENQENVPLSKKAVVVLKKESAQKTEASNKASKRENESKMSLADLQSLLSESEGRSEGQAANIDSLTATSKTKDEIINALHQRLGQGSDSQTDPTQEHSIGYNMDRSLPVSPQRERTIIGGDSQQDALPHLSASQQEHDALNKALRAEQQSYSSLVRTVKEQDSAQRLHASQSESTAVQLLRQQLEDGIKANKELRDDLEREVQRAKLREGMDLTDPRESESMRHQLEDAQRWNASSQARLGAIQNRGGGVGGASDGADTWSFIGDQTSYMSICVGEGPDDSLSQLSPQELQQKVSDSQDRVNGSQSLNNESQSRLSQMEKSEQDASEKEAEDSTSRNRFKQLEKTHERRPSDDSDRERLPDQDKEIKTNISLGQIASGNSLGDESMESRSSQSREHAHSDSTLLRSGDDDRADRNTDAVALTSSSGDLGSSSISQLRDEVLRLRSENSKSWGLSKEQKSTECKEKESADASGNSSDGQAELRRSSEAPGSEDGSVVFNLSKENMKKSNSASDGETSGTNISPADGNQSPKPQSPQHYMPAKQHATRHRAGVKSRLPVPVRLRVEGSTNRQCVTSDQTQAEEKQHPTVDELSGSDQQSPTNSDLASRPNTSPSSTVTRSHAGYSPAGSDGGSEPGTPTNHPHSQSALLSQLQLSNQECQEKEASIHKMGEQLADLDELRAQSEEKERSNGQYTVASQAAQSTIAYLTACSSDNQNNFGPHTVSGSMVSNVDLHSRCMESQKASQEKEELNNQLIELSNMAEKAIASTPSQDGKPGTDDLCSSIEGILHQVHSQRDSPDEVGGRTGESVFESQRHAESLQKALLEQSKLNAELQEQSRAANAAARCGCNSDGTHLNGPPWRQKEAATEVLDGDEKKDDHNAERGFGHPDLHQEMFSIAVKCLSATESAVSSLALHCKNAASPACAKLEPSADSQKDFDHLQRALLERDRLTESARQGRKCSSSSPSASSETGGQKLHQDLCHLYNVICDYARRSNDVQAPAQQERGHRRESEAHRMMQDAKGLAPDVKLQSETLHKASREKKKAYKSSEEKSATALINTPSPETARKAPEQGDKSVQVDFQDSGYETSGKSENDREESSSTDSEVGVNPSCSASSLPSSLKNEHATFSSTENSDSSSSTPYPSSPAHSSTKVSSKSLQMYDEYGASEDPSQLQAQVRELKVQSENQTKVILQMQSLSHRNSLSSDIVANTSDSLAVREKEGTHKVESSQDRGGQSMDRRESENQSAKDGPRVVWKERTPNRSTNEQLLQTRSRSTSPARLDSSVKSQARELSQLRQQIKESRRSGVSQRRQSEESKKSFKDSLNAGEVDRYMSEAVKEQSDKSSNLSDRSEGRSDKEESHLVREDVEDLESSHRLAKELQEKNGLIQSLQSQIQAQTPRSHHSSHSDVTASFCQSSTSTQGGSGANSQQHSADNTGASVSPAGGASERGASPHLRSQGSQRENRRLQEQSRSNEELNATLRSELDSHRSIMAQTGFHHQEQDSDRDQEASAAQTATPGRGEDISTQEEAEPPRIINSDSSAEHLQEIRALRQRLEESIRTNDRSREQLERRLAEVEKDPAATNIFIHGNEEQGQSVNEVRFSWEQNQVLKEQSSVGSRDKQKENEKSREASARRTAKSEQSRKECDASRQENVRSQETSEHSRQENSSSQNSSHSRGEESQRLQCEVKSQRQQLSDSQHSSQSSRVELQVYENVKNDSNKHAPLQETPHPVPVSSSGSVNLGESSSEIRHSRSQSERSIQTNTASRQKSEEQSSRGGARSDTININYSSSSPEGGRSPGRDGCDPQHHSFRSHERTSVHHEVKHHARSEMDADSVCSSAPESVSAAPSRSVPGHRMWANRSGRHVSGLIEDYNALRKQISEGRQSSRLMDESSHALREQGSDGEKQHWKSLSSSTNTMQQVLEEAGRSLKSSWRVSSPAGGAAGGGANNNQQDESSKNEIARSKSRLSQQERMSSGAVKRSRSTNQLKEGMERIIIDQLSSTHGVLKKARGNLETNYCSLFGQKVPSGGPGEGQCGWVVGLQGETLHEFHELSHEAKANSEPFESLGVAAPPDR